jgi:GNAT superfamily N-acetyltransferase
MPHQPDRVDRPRVVDATLVDDCVEILVGAFYDDPLWSWAFPDDGRRREQHRVLWRLMVEGAIRYPWTWITAGSTAASLWIPPGGSELSDEAAEDLESVLVDLLGDGASRALGAMAALEDAHPRHTPHFYLSLLGTDPAQRGHGYGLGLLADNLRAIDALGAPAYLESSNSANVALYARHGFVPVGVATPPGGPDVVTMWREPAPRD